eukprot:70880-Chlamydomonas_euryale.AAC.1
MRWNASSRSLTRFMITSSTCREVWEEEANTGRGCWVGCWVGWGRKAHNNHLKHLSEHVGTGETNTGRDGGGGGGGGQEKGSRRSWSGRGQV